VEAIRLLARRQVIFLDCVYTESMGSLVTVRQNLIDQAEMVIFLITGGTRLRPSASGDPSRLAADRSQPFARGPN